MAMLTVGTMLMLHMVPVLAGRLRRAGSRVRTDDLLITNQLLYQLSYAGLCFAGGRLVAIQPLLNRILRDPLIRYLARE